MAVASQSSPLAVKLVILSFSGSHLGQFSQRSSLSSGSVSLIPRFSRVCLGGPVPVLSLAGSLADQWQLSSLSIISVVRFPWRLRRSPVQTSRRTVAVRSQWATVVLAVALQSSHQIMPQSRTVVLVCSGLFTSRAASILLIAFLSFELGY